MIVKADLREGKGRGREGMAGMNNNTNLYAALRKKKKAPGSKNGSSKATPEKVQDAEKFWAQPPLITKSWADVDDEDDDSFYANAAPPLGISSEPRHSEEAIEESETDEDDDLLDEADDDIEDDQENEGEDMVLPEADLKKHVETVAVHKEPDRQLSKKEKKKKELEELDALLADFAIAPDDNGRHDSNAVNERTEVDQGEEEKKESGTTESKSAKKKKKKEKSKESSETPNPPTVVETAEDTGLGTEEDASSIDVKERIKKVASMKKKKPSKEMDGAAKAAAQEAAARRAKLAAAKKKEKNHYNQQPVR